MLKAVITVCLAVGMPVYTSQCDAFSQQHDFVHCNVFSSAEIYYLINNMVPCVVKYTFIFGKGISRESFNFSGENIHSIFY